MEGSALQTGLSPPEAKPGTVMPLPRHSRGVARMPRASRRPSAADQPRTYVLDTNVLISDPDALGRFQEHDVVVPLTVIEELDKLKARPDELGASARRAVRALEALREQGSLAEGVASPGGGRVRVAEEYRHEQVAVEGYPGVSTVELAGGLDALYAGRGGQVAAPEPLLANQFVVLRSGNQSALGQVTRSAAAGETVELVLLGEAPETFGVRARSKEQHFALHLLRDPKIPLVSLAGLAGTGKTYLAIAAGLDATLEHRAYDRVLVFRPVVPVGRQELGFLPGDVEEKITPWMKAIYDVLAQLFRGSHDADRRESYVQDLVQGLLDDGTVQLEPLTFIRGRTFVRTFAILDEAQNVEYGVLRSLASRLGEGSKLVMCHDTSQGDHPYVDPDSGAAAMIERLKGEPLSGHVTLLKGERSPVAELVARKL